MYSNTASLCSSPNIFFWYPLYFAVRTSCSPRIPWTRTQRAAEVPRCLSRPFPWTWVPIAAIATACLGPLLGRDQSSECSRAWQSNHVQLKNKMSYEITFYVESILLYLIILHLTGYLVTDCHLYSYQNDPFWTTLRLCLEAHRLSTIQSLFSICFFQIK